MKRNFTNCWNRTRLFSLKMGWKLQKQTKNQPLTTSPHDFLICRMENINFISFLKITFTFEGATSTGTRFLSRVAVCITRIACDELQLIATQHWNGWGINFTKLRKRSTMQNWLIDIPAKDLLLFSYSKNQMRWLSSWTERDSAGSAPWHKKYEVSLKLAD